MTEGSVGISTNRRGEFRARDHGGLRAALLAAGVVVMLVGLYARVLPLWLQDLWDDPNYSHVFIVPIISGFVLWRNLRSCWSRTGITSVNSHGVDLLCKIGLAIHRGLTRGARHTVQIRGCGYLWKC